MKISIKISWCILVTLFFTTTGFTQKVPPPPPPPGMSKVQREQWKVDQKQREKEQKESAKQEKKQAKQAKAIENAYPINIISNYDKFKDLTVVGLNSMPVKTESLNTPLGGSNFWMQAAVAYVGNQTDNPSQAIISFTARTRDYSTEAIQPSLIFIADGERINIGAINVEREYKKELVILLGEIPVTLTTMSASMPFETYKKIASAQSVEFQLSGIEGTLLERHLQGLRQIGHL